ncbi:arsenate reductase ArsC [Azomonas macrocytogenes]|uniref:Protein-tyrosine-phosphatase n=1 Tax=Azomonas macrocytogenes TaxID=69962 RepID=A0A839T7J9_AZOMA|nr:arsenate reductase ArsC [Azomonas macrocytogenes]MBB3105058.1 protein-tyrosine-phosphatase [Azomonas macrocytogenes]
MSDKTRVLFVCVANAARSQLAEALLRHTDPEHFEAFSAGTAPSAIDPNTYEVLQHLGVSTEGLRSKAIDEFAGERFEYVITLCDKSASECHALPGAGEVMAWDFEDPVTSDRPNAFRHTLHEIHERIKLFVLAKTRR